MQIEAIAQTPVTQTTGPQSSGPQTPGVLALAEPKSPPVPHSNLMVRDSNPMESRFDEHRATELNVYFTASGLFDSSINDELMETQRRAVNHDPYSSPALRIRFQPNLKTGRVAISVIDAKTREIIREIPIENGQNVTEKLKENLGGLFDRNL